MRVFQRTGILVYFPMNVILQRMVNELWLQTVQGILQGI